MYFLRMYEFMVLDRGHVLTMNYFNQGYGRNFVGPGFLNAVNRYYGYRVWR
jgi:hypothetical protein